MCSYTGCPNKFCTVHSDPLLAKKSNCTKKCLKEVQLIMRENCYPTHTKLVGAHCILISWKIGGSFSTWSAINSRVPQHSVIHSFLAPLITEQLQFFFKPASCCCFQIEPVLLLLLFLAFRSEKLFFSGRTYHWAQVLLSSTQEEI